MRSETTAAKRDVSVVDELRGLISRAMLLQGTQRSVLLREVLAIAQKVGDYHESSPYVDVASRCFWLLGDIDKARRLVIKYAPKPVAVPEVPSIAGLGTAALSAAVELWRTSVSFLEVVIADGESLVSVRTLAIEATLQFLSHTAQNLSIVNSRAALDRVGAAEVVAALPDAYGLGYRTAGHLADFLLEDCADADLRCKVQRWARCFDINVWLQASVWMQ